MILLTIGVVNPWFNKQGANAVNDDNGIWIDSRNSLDEIISMVIGRQIISKCTLACTQKKKAKASTDHPHCHQLCNKSIPLFSRVYYCVPVMYASPESALMNTNATSLPAAVVAAATKSVSLIELEITLLPAECAVIAEIGSTK